MAAFFVCTESFGICTPEGSNSGSIIRTINLQLHSKKIKISTYSKKNIHLHH